MSQQTRLTCYFKSKALPVQSNRCVSYKMNKKRSLSMKKPSSPSTSSTQICESPRTPMKKEVTVKQEENTITLSSDSEEEGTPVKKPFKGISVRSIESLTAGATPAFNLKSPNSSFVDPDASDSSPTAFVYNLSPGAVLGPPPTTPKSASPGSSSKYFSPTKKRCYKTKSPAKRNLANQFGEKAFTPSPPDNFLYQTDQLDDKTSFLMTIIDKYLNSDTLRPFLAEESQILLEKCTIVANPGKDLICRLYWRKPIWYRLDSLAEIVNNKKEVKISSPDMLNLLSSMETYGFLTAAGTEGDSKLEFDDYMQLLKRPELLQIAKELKLKIQNKQDAIGALRNYCKLKPISNFLIRKGNSVNDNSHRVLAILKSKTGRCYKMSQLAQDTFYKLYVLMYLGMDYSIIRDRQLELVLLYDKIKREMYPVDKDMVVDDASCVFQDKEQFDRYIEAHMLYESYLEKPSEEKHLIIKQAHALYKGLGEELMQRGAANTLLEGLNSENMFENMKDALRPRALKLANQQNIDLKETLRNELQKHGEKQTVIENRLPGDHIHKQPIDNHNQRGKLKFEVHCAEGRGIVTAEEYCIAHYVNNGGYSKGEHLEGRIVSTIYTALFWDIIYCKPRGLPGIFINHYQRYPLDMFSTNFYINRKTQIDERLTFIQECTDQQLVDFLKNQWDARPETVISDMLRSIGWENICEVVLCLRPRGVADICRRLVLDYGYCRSGFPDLTLWNISTRKIKFVEVKTDADKPSVKQLQWLQYLIDHGIDAGFCYVGVNTTRSRARPSASNLD
ncbi:fanconi-associated nuclease 1 homolog [Spodoptera litura]|uniref:Fanconi-associated nuclease n=1 Tax=Spodoptera litura TaxID=69820 RepID=A0A9J7IIL7_SPOLT|nr:fanconi-associated nuclease 1 homolog [Spodoptera litura]